MEIFKNLKFKLINLEEKKFKKCENFHAHENYFLN